MNRPTFFVLNKVNVQYAEKLIQNIKADKDSGEDKIPPRLVKMASNILSEPITDIINTAIDTNTFRDRAKRASAAPIDNYRPVSALFFSIIIHLFIQIHICTINI